MSKNLRIISILAIFVLVGMTPFVMGATTLPAALNQKYVASNLHFQSSQTNARAIGTLSPNTWYYGKVDDVWPWMQSDDTTFNLIVGRTTYFCTVKPASTVNGWNNAFMQNQIVDCIIAAQETNHYINVHTDADTNIDQVRLTATRV